MQSVQCLHPHHNYHAPVSQNECTFRLCNKKPFELTSCQPSCPPTKADQCLSSPSDTTHTYTHTYAHQIRYIQTCTRYNAYINTSTIYIWYTHIYIRCDTYMHIHTSDAMHVCNIHQMRYIHTRIHTYIRTYMHTYIHTYTYICICTHVRCSACVYTYVCTICDAYKHAPAAATSYTRHDA